MINLNETLKNYQVYYKFKDSKRPTRQRPYNFEFIKKYRYSQTFLIDILASDLQPLYFVKETMSLTFTYSEEYKAEDEILPEFVDIRDLYRHYKIDYEVVEIYGDYYIQFKGANKTLLSLVEHKIIDKDDFVDNTPTFKTNYRDKFKEDNTVIKNTISEIDRIKENFTSHSDIDKEILYDTIYDLYERKLNGEDIQFTDRQLKSEAYVKIDLLYEKEGKIYKSLQYTKKKLEPYIFKEVLSEKKKEIKGQKITEKNYTIYKKQRVYENRIDTDLVEEFSKDIQNTFIRNFSYKKEQIKKEINKLYKRYGIKRKAQIKDLDIFNIDYEEIENDYILITNTNEGRMIYNNVIKLFK